MAQGPTWLNVVIFPTGDPGAAQPAPVPATILILSSASPPPRPTPPPGGGGGQPPLGIWGPSDPRPTNPIAGFDPIHGTFPEGPGGGGGGGTPPGLKPPSGDQVGLAAVKVSPEPAPGAPPADMPDATYSLVSYGPGQTAHAWIGPYIDPRQ